MAINSFTLANITDRILLTLPSKFTKESTSNVYKFFEAIGNAFLITTEQIDELFRQTNLDTATGAYVDDYVGQLAKLGRFRTGTVYLDADETDTALKTKYKRTISVYNSTKEGLSQIVIDFNGTRPMNMYIGKKRGAYANARYYFNSGSLATYGSAVNNPFVGYIEFSRRPNSWILAEMRKTLNKCRGYGIKIYLKYPDDDDLDIVLADGSYDRVVLA